jgi:O-antigen/teichoic acid export membrane protein
MWFLHAWRPAWIFEMQSLRTMFGFGSRMLASGLIDQIFSNLYFVVIGRLFSAADLGYYARAKSIQELPTNTISGLFARVTFPLFSRLQDDPVLLKRGMRKSLIFLMLINIPMMIGLAAIAEPLILLLLTEKWAECIPYLQLLCFYGLLHPLNLINLNLLLSVGRSELYLRLEIIKKVLIVICVATTWPFGITGMIYGLILFSVVSCYLNSYYTGKFIGYPLREQLIDVLPYFIVSGAMGIGMYAIGSLPFPNDWVRLLANLTAGTLLYMGLCLLFRLEAFMEFWETARSKWAVLKNEAAGLRKGEGRHS